MSSPAPNVRWHDHADVTALRRMCVGQRGVTAWMTGLSGSGKSTIGFAAQSALLRGGRLAACLDGDNLRHGLNAGLGFGAADRAEAVRRAGEASLLLAQAGAIVLVGMISPSRSTRDEVRARHRAAGVPFLEVFVSVPLEVAESRDPKGLYARARAGEIRGFTGIDDPYEPPLRPELVLDSSGRSADDCVADLCSLVVVAATRD